LKETLDAVHEFYAEFNPGFALDYKFMDQEYASLYEAEQRVASLSQYFAGFAILISCLGLFGLAAFTAERRIKEIGIRKALGSSVRNIIVLLTRDFTRLVFFSIIIAIPVSYLLVGQWLMRFAYRIDLSWQFFAGAGLIAIVIAWLTVGIQAFKAAKVNPSRSLRNE